MTGIWSQAIFYSFCLITLIQLFYYLYFFLRLAFHRKSIEPSSSKARLVSVIICARNEAANLAKNLPGILNQKYSTSYEIIVVNDNSVDDSKTILADLQKTFKQLHVVDVKRKVASISGKKLPLGVGINSAKYETLLLTDADCLPASEFWVKKMLQGYERNIEIVLGYGGYNKRKGFLNKLIRWETFHTALQYLSYAKAGMAYMGVGRNLSYTKSIFFRHKGFLSHENIISGDDDLLINKAATRNNTAIVIDPDAITLSDPPQNWKQWKSQKTRHYSTARFYKILPKLLLALYSLTHFLFYPLFVVTIFCMGLKMALVVFTIRFFVQCFVFFKTMKKLNEHDLFLWFPIFDVWMFCYYLIFSFSLFKSPGTKWKQAR